MIFVDKRDGEKKQYLLNLIDTPGHIDFSYEVSRSLASCQGALLLVDSTQSIQAQTLANYEKAMNLGLTIIPIVTKIDLPNAQPEDAALSMASAFQLDPDSVIMTSAKKQIGILDVMHAIVDRLPPPLAFSSNPMNSHHLSSLSANHAGLNSAFHGRIVDSWFDEHRGVVCLVQVVGGQLKEGQRITTFASIKESKEIDSRSDFSVQEIGVLTPGPLRTSSLSTGQVGYVIAGLRSTRQARIGDTMYIPAEWTQSSTSIAPLPGYEAAKPMLFASIYPVNSDELEGLIAAVDRLCLNDSSISVVKDQSASLGSGLRCGFLGFLHMEVFNQRLKDEFDVDIVMTTPSVPYILEFDEDVRRGVEKSTVTVSCVSQWPVSTGSKNSNPSFTVLEPIVKVVLVSPKDHYGAMMELIKERRGTDIDVQYLEEKNQVLLTAFIPWQEVVCDMNDQVKHHSSGYASFNYQEAGYKAADLVKVEIAVNGEVCEPLSFVCHASKAVATGRKMAIKLKEVLARQQFEIVLQAKVGVKIVAKERIAPYRKDVLSRSGKTVGGGDITRKKKLLEKQKEGKKRAKMVGKVEIGQEAFWTVLQR
mmetsp:Transcript_20440/g.28111  ORF Transcript_20440/g.28111 Transcript_20440/m.28111 type:complete len:590 (+) Transcript_20440:144-1913(+)